MYQREVTPFRTVVYRCGTSKGIFLHENDLPQDPETRDKVIMAIFGSPDPRQIDGLGGADVLTSKLALIGPPSVPDADVDYTFGQVDIETAFISYSGLCGNISSGIAPFAIEEGLVRAVEPVTKVRVYSKNTDQIYVTEVPVKNGRPLISGDYVVPGVPGTGAKLNIDMVGTVGSYGKGLLPTGKAKDVFDVPGFGKIEGSLIDTVNPCLFLRAKDLGLKGNEVKKSDFEDGKLELLETVRREAAFKAIGKAYVEKDAIPFLVYVAEPMDYVDHLTGDQIKASDVDFLARAFFLGAIHQTFPGSMSCCTGAAAVIPGTVVYEIRGKKASPEVLLGHPGGVIDIEAVCETDKNGGPVLTRATYGRTARRIMDGYCYVPNKLFMK
ncbi:MAG: 3-methylitaconate isomerase [Oscillospiraceae bacterium]|nr:3-methylitaconate isomerase [Oscillospiraceae bacterium]